MLYQSAEIYDSDTIPQLDLNATVNPDCYLADNTPINNPPPMAGFDTRCRPWYQSSFKKKKSNQVDVDEPYVFVLGYYGVGMTLTHYFKLEGYGPTLEGVIATDVQK